MCETKSVKSAIYLDMNENLTQLTREQVKMLDKLTKKLKKGDNVVLTGGLINGNPGNTNMIKLETVK